MANKCIYCGAHHDAVCPRISAITYWPDGITVKRVDFHPPTIAESSDGVKVSIRWPTSIKTAVQ